MKKNSAYVQTCILNELMKQYSPQDIATEFLNSINKKDVECSIYETRTDGMVFRKKRDCIITDDMIVKAFYKSVLNLIEDAGDDFIDMISDRYDVKISKSMITDDFIKSVLLISTTGRLMSLEIDLQ